MIVLLAPDASPEAVKRVVEAVRELGLEAVPLADAKGDGLEVVGAGRGRVLALRALPGVQEILTRRTALTGGEPLWPHVALRVAVLACLLLVVLFLLSAFFPPGLGDAARPGAEAHTEWYLRPLTGFLDLCSGLAGTLLAVLFWVLFFAWPFLDRADPGTVRGRRVVHGMRLMGVVLLLFILVLAFRGAP